MLFGNSVTAVHRPEPAKACYISLGSEHFCWFRVSAALPLSLPAIAPGWLGLALVAAVVALVAWELQLMQTASDSNEPTLLLAGCMVCGVAAGLSVIYVLTLLVLPDPLTMLTAKASNDLAPWAQQVDCFVAASDCPGRPAPLASQPWAPLPLSSTATMPTR